MPDAFTGFVEGFQGRREDEYAKNAAREKENRAMADRVFTLMLNSRDRPMQELAMRGLAAPTGKKKGLAGYLGGVESDANPIYQQILARMNEMVPDDGGAPPAQPAPPTQPTASAAPGSAAMSTNQMTRPGSAPPQMPAQPPTAGAGMSEDDVMSGAAPAPALGMPEGAAMPPPPPPESKWKRRGTGIPTAEEIREWSESAALHGRITAATSELQGAGASPDAIQQAIMGMLGAPQNQRDLSAVTQWGVQLPGSDEVVPVLLDQHKGYVTAGGQPLPPGAQMIRMNAGAGGAGLTSYVEDSPAQRAQLQSQYPGLQMPPGPSPTGYLKLQVRADGSAMAIPSEFTPPPALSGTFETTDPQDPTIPVRRGITRGGTPGSVLGDVASPVPSQYQEGAKGLKAAVDAEVQAMASRDVLKRRPTPQAIDSTVARLAATQGLHFSTYAELEQAAVATAPISAREKASGGSLVDQIISKADENRRAGQRGTGAVAPAPPAPAPSGPSPSQSNRARGAGPVGAPR